MFSHLPLPSLLKINFSPLSGDDMRNESKIIPLKSQWLLKLTYFSRSGQIGVGLTREEWLPENRFTSKILLDLEEARSLQRKLQSLIDKASKMGDGENEQEEKKEKETST